MMIVDVSFARYCPKEAVWWFALKTRRGNRPKSGADMPDSSEGGMFQPIKLCEYRPASAFFP